MGGLSKFRNSIETNDFQLEVDKETFRNIVTGKIYKIMMTEGISKSDLSKSLKISRPAITALLSGDRNMTIDKITEISNAIGYKPSISFYKNKSYSENEITAFVKVVEEKKKSIKFTTEDMNFYSITSNKKSMELYITKQRENIDG